MWQVLIPLCALSDKREKHHLFVILLQHSWCWKSKLDKGLEYLARLFVVHLPWLFTTSSSYTQMHSGTCAFINSVESLEAQTNLFSSKLSLLWLHTQNHFLLCILWHLNWIFMHKIKHSSICVAADDFFSGCFRYLSAGRQASKNFCWNFSSLFSLKKKQIVFIAFFYKVLSSYLSYIFLSPYWA